MTKMKNKKELARIRRHMRLRKKISGTQERPRLTVHRSLANLYAQFIDDAHATTLCSISTQDPSVKEKVAYGGNVKAAETLGQAAAELARTKGITRVVFDRSGRVFHGRIKAFADAARKHGLQF